MAIISKQAPRAFHRFEELNKMNHFEIVKEFTDILASCQGKVTFVTAQGDRLVTDSMLSALVGFASLISVAGSIDVHLNASNRKIAKNCAPL